MEKFYRKISRSDYGIPSKIQFSDFPSSIGKIGGVTEIVMIPFLSESGNREKRIFRKLKKSKKDVPLWVSSHFP